jgi:pilus assembly protein TadC
METLAPPLRLLQTVRYVMEGGESLRQGLHEYLKSPPDDFTITVKAWLQLLERGCLTAELLQKISSPARRHLLTLLERGLRGEPVLAALEALDDEIQEQSLAEIESFLGTLPFRMLLPLLFFLFPAFLVLLIGPLLMRVVGFAG